MSDAPYDVEKDPYPLMSKWRQSERHSMIGALREMIDEATRMAKLAAFGLTSRDEPIINPDLDSKQAILRTYNSTLIPRGFHGDQETLDKPITNPSRKNTPRIPPRQQEDLENNFL